MVEGEIAKSCLNDKAIFTTTRDKTPRVFLCSKTEDQMINYTTPTITLTVKGVDISSGFDVYVTIEQGSRKLTKTGNDLELTAETVGEFTKTTVVFTLTQEESAVFDYGRPATIQVNWIDTNGKRAATLPAPIDVMRNILDEILENA